MINDIVLALLFSDKGITKNDVVIKGFVDIFLDDVERPYLDHHAFIMYDLSKVDANYIKLMGIFEEADNLYGSYSIRISGVFYKIFCFTINPAYYREYKYIKTGRFTEIKEPMKSIILEYNNDNITGLLKFMTNDSLVDKVIPEQDYIPPME